MSRGAERTIYKLLRGQDRHHRLSLELSTSSIGSLLTYLTIFLFNSLTWKAFFGYGTYLNNMLNGGFCIFIGTYELKSNGLSLALLFFVEASVLKVLLQVWQMSVEESPGTSTAFTTGSPVLSISTTHSHPFQLLAKRILMATWSLALPIIWL